MSWRLTCPLLMLGQTYATCCAKFKTIAKGDGPALQAFYSKEIRND